MIFAENRELRHAVAALIWILGVAMCLCAVRCSAQVANRDALELLGKTIFFDKRISVDGTTACASCHQQKYGMSDGRRLAVGLIGSKNAPNGLIGIRNTPTIYNAAMKGPQFVDHRAKSVFDQCLMPTENPIEMGQQTIGQVVNRLSRIPGYASMFYTAFGDRRGANSPITADRMRLALVAFIATVKSSDAPADYLAKLDVREDNAANVADSAGISESAVRGWLIFSKHGSYSCVECHMPEHNWSAGGTYNIGISVRTNPRNPDLGRQKITGNREDYCAFQIPTLREIQDSGPYMHDGSFKTLAEVVAYYNAGGQYVRKGKLMGDPRRVEHIREPMNLSKEQQADLVEFLASGFRGKKPVIEAPEMPR